MLIYQLFALFRALLVSITLPPHSLNNYDDYPRFTPASLITMPRIATIRDYYAHICGWWLN
jgi:hypothetical protein